MEGDATEKGLRRKKVMRDTLTVHGIIRMTSHIAILPVKTLTTCSDSSSEYCCSDKITEAAVNIS